jgi:hypothetical protein
MTVEGGARGKRNSMAKRKAIYAEFPDKLKDYWEQTAISVYCATCNHHGRMHDYIEGCSLCVCKRFIGDEES